MEQVWIAPLPASAATGTRKSASQDTRRIHVAAEFAPTSSPAPAGNAIVPAGWILQQGPEGETDVSLGDTRGGGLQYDATMTQVAVPINSGGWPPLGDDIPQNAGPLGPGPLHWGILYDESFYDDDVYAG